MRIRQCSSNCSFTTTFEEFEEKMLDGGNVFFTPDFDSFSFATIQGEVIEEYDIFYERGGEKEEFIQYLKDSVYGEFLDVFDE